MKIALSCIASIDYLEKYKKCIESHRHYCKKFNYEYHLNTESENINHWKDWYWKKIIEAKKLLTNYDFIVIIDCDCEITTKAESLETILDQNSIYYVLGISGRPNSGFLIIKNNSCGNNFLQDLLLKRNQSLPDKYKSTKGENGHVIWALGENPDSSKELEMKWNCSQPEHIEKAFIIHYTNKMRNYYEAEQ